MTDEHPKVYTKMNLEYLFYGKNIKEKDVERAIELSQTKYYGVTAMFEKAMTITHSIKNVESKENYSCPLDFQNSSPIMIVDQDLTLVVSAGGDTQGGVIRFYILLP